MEDQLMIKKQEFIAWLSSAMVPSALDDVQRSINPISMILVQKKALHQPLMETTQIEEVENALNLSKKIFGSKKMRNTAQKLLNTYVIYLREKKNTVPSKKNISKIDVQENWIKFDFSNSDQFERTVPAYCSIKGQELVGRNWAHILVGLAEQELAKNNSSLKLLYERSLIASRKNRPFFLKKKLDGLNCTKLSNGYWLNVNYNIPRLMDQILALSLQCGYSKSEIVIFGILKGNQVSPKPFDIQEAVILLDVYLSCCKTGLTNSQAAAIASQRLRTLAICQGMKIDNAYRSAAGIQGRLRSIGCIFEGNESVSAPSTQVFQDAVNLFNNSPEEYEKVLNTVSNIVTAAMPTVKKEKKSGYGVSIGKAENHLLHLGLAGATVQEIIDVVQPGAAVSSTRNALDISPNVIAMPKGRYVHIKAFVDLDEAKKNMQQILKTHFAQFCGYSNNKLLFGAASHDLSMFLNDNDCADVNSVYSLAQYFFEKTNSKESYVFSPPHIFEKNPDFPLTLKGLMINLARMNGGILHVDDAKNYLQKTLLSYGSIVQVLQLSSSDTFLYYDEQRFLLTEYLQPDDKFQHITHDKLENLFRQANIAYVIPRDITDSWLKTLPSLPQGLPWTLLLLQEILRNFPNIGFRPITTELNQAANTIAAAIVPASSALQSFSDIVTLYMQSKHTLPQRMTCEELRQELREAGILEGNELINALPKALNDYRFSWTDENKMVLVRGN